MMFFGNTPKSPVRLEESLDLPVMVAFPVPAETGLTLLALVTPAVSDNGKILPLNELHLTLALLGESDEVAVTQPELIRMVGAFAVDHMPITGHISGVGLFNLEGNDEYKSCLYASFDSPELVAFRQDLVMCLEKCGVDIEKEHGFTPHVSLAYLPKQGDISKFEIPRIDLTFDKMVVAWGKDWTMKEIGGWSMRVKPMDGEPMVMGMMTKAM